MSLILDGKVKRVSVHRLVAMYHIPNPLNKAWVNHKDGNKLNNHVLNLERTTPSENIQHSFTTLNRTTKKGREHWNYGKQCTQGTKNKMAAAKIGENHPKFKGWYILNGIKYPTPNEPAKILGLSTRTVSRHKNTNKIQDLSFTPI